MDFKFELDFAREMDRKDPLQRYRKEFLFPQHQGRDSIYFTGNSLGLQPRKAREALQQELNDWEKYGVEGHFDAKHPWFSYHEMFAEPLARLVGAKPTEVVAMNGLTTNLHLMMVSFYRPTKERYKIICEAKAFPSDLYALESQARHHGLNPDDTIIALEPREDEHTLRTEDVLKAIKDTGSELALVMIGGVNYYTGQVFDMETVTASGHEVGANVGWDLAHAAGNIPLHLHDWGVDFACWCSYKYLNSGPGSVSGVFVHEKHCKNKDLPRFAGWWGHDKETRFLMEKGFTPTPTAESWQLSNAPVLAMAVHKVALDLHDEVGIEKLREKSVQLTAYLEFIIREVSNQSASSYFEIITPEQPKERGCQLSILAHGLGRPLFDKLTQGGVIADWREPNVIRIAPVPIYNSFEDCFRFGEILSSATQN
ncbi:MAG: kynureninase [Crocinitomicaceae bacterium]|nr:kynureninase [Crocinitomicaceae bacterium]|tara:strand:+ start:8605 stop:9882 length:1278 start_codon:yes stop_codon:yes gene_type:complete